MKASALTIIILIAGAALMGSASAVGPGVEIQYEGGNMGKVVFNGKVHAYSEKGALSATPVFSA